MDHFVTNSCLASAPLRIQSKAGAVPVKNDKREVSMKKVKEHRYVASKIRDYNSVDSSEEESEEDDFLEKGGSSTETSSETEDNEQIYITEKDDSRPRLNLRFQRQRNEDDRDKNRRDVEEPEVLDADEGSKNSTKRIKLDSSEANKGEISDVEIERRREAFKQRPLSRQEEEKLLKKDDEEEKSDDSSEESSEYQEHTDYENEKRPVFVHERNMITDIKKEKKAQEAKQAEIEPNKLVEERKRQTLRLVKESIRKETQARSNLDEKEGNVNDVNTEDENHELGYEPWKLRELKRNKRDREERAAVEKVHPEIERLRNMTEEEKRQEARMNPQIVILLAATEKYKFLQKYYHRSIFYSD